MIYHLHTCPVIVISLTFSVPNQINLYCYEEDVGNTEYFKFTHSIYGEVHIRNHIVEPHRYPIPLQFWTRMAVPMVLKTKVNDL